MPGAGINETTISCCLDKLPYLIRFHIKVNQRWGIVIGRLDNATDHEAFVVHVISKTSAGWGWKIGCICWREKERGESQRKEEEEGGSECA